MTSENKTLQILMLEDVVTDARLIESELERASISFQARRVETRDDFMLGIKTFAPDIILSDYSLPHFNGLDALRLVREVSPTTPFIIVTGSISEETAVECMKAGAADYVIKEHLIRLGRAVAGALELKRAKEAKKLAEEKLKKTVAELARSNADLERFASVASHDMQEPLRTVASYVQLLAHRYQGKLGVEADDFIQFAVEGTHRMKRIIDGLLEYSRVGKEGPELLLISGDEVFQQALTHLQIAIDESGASITADPLPTIKSNTLLLGQVFQNLLSNAIKFRGSDPPRIHVQARREGPQWVFSFCDNGIGIDPKYAGRLFEIFQRLHSPHRYPGNGLGLAICKKIVEHLGGRIGVHSQPNKGATFWFTLPAEEELTVQ